MSSFVDAVIATSTQGPDIDWPLQSSEEARANFVVDELGVCLNYELVVFGGDRYSILHRLPSHLLKSSSIDVA